MNHSVTAVVSTKDRYFTTLPNLLVSIALQTMKPKKLIIYDDGEQKDLRKEPLYHNIFVLLERNGISWEVKFGNQKGQVDNHQRSIEDAETEWIWRLDDDNVAEPDVLEKLLKNVSDDVGAVGGLVLDPKFNYNNLNKLASNKIEDIYLGLNVQWYKWAGEISREVDHLYSTFIYRREAAKKIGGYCMELSRVGHREETIFTYSLKRAGWKILVDSSAITWHMRDPQGGIRSDSHKDMWGYDEMIFRRKMEDWGVKATEMKLCVLDSGLGDHLIFSKVLQDLKKKNLNIVVACCYPEVFKEEKSIITISISDAQQMVDINEHNIYKWMWDRGWTKSLEQAYREMYDA